MPKNKKSTASTRKTAKSGRKKTASAAKKKRSSSKTKSVKRSSKATSGKTKRKVAKKSSKKPAAKKTTAKKSVAKKTVAKKVVVRKKAEKPVRLHIPADEKREFIQLLLDLRERLKGQIESLKGGSLTRSDSVASEEDGTDAFDRQFALKLVSSEHDIVFEIDEALRRIEARTYGVCEGCKKAIEKLRLKALPFVKMCVKCQSEIENGRPGFYKINSLALNHEAEAER
ncbi:TraR/DksA family transcriptional regulator [Verrucomicrobiota bacterium]